MRKLLFLCLTLMLASCSKNLVPFNQNLYDRYRWTNDELKNIQFYLSNDLELFKKDVTNSEANIEDGAVRIKKEFNGEKVIIKKGTAGVFIFSPKDNRFAISFSNTDEKYLIFGPNPKMNYDYTLFAKSWGKANGIVTYNNEEYYVNNRDAYTRLLIDLQRTSTRKVKVKEEPGRRI